MVLSSILPLSTQNLQVSVQVRVQTNCGTSLGPPWNLASRGLCLLSIFGNRKSLPWITQEIKRYIRRRDSLYQKQKRSRKPKDRSDFLKAKHKVNASLKRAYHTYIEGLLGLDDPSASTTATEQTCTSKYSPKRLYSFLKACRQDAQGVAPLRKDGLLHTDNQVKASIWKPDTAIIALSRYRLVFCRVVALSTCVLSRYRVVALSRCRVIALSRYRLVNGSRKLEHLCIFKLKYKHFGTITILLLLKIHLNVCIMTVTL